MKAFHSPAGVQKEQDEPVEDGTELHPALPAPPLPPPSFSKDIMC